MSINPFDDDNGSFFVLERVGKVARRACVTDVTGVASMGAWRRANSIHPISPMRSGR
jgi:hypothetical protein